MLLVVYFISFFLLCHQTGWYIVRLTERTRCNILTCIFYVIFQSQCQHNRVLELKCLEKKKRFSRVGKIARIQFLSKRYFKLTRRHFSSYNQPYLNVMSENALISHHRYKAVRSFCFETFKHRLYPNATTKTSYGITGECKSFKRRQLFSVLCFTGARLIRYSNFQAELHLHLHVNLRLQRTATSLQ